MGEKKYGTLEEKGGVYEGYFKNNKKSLNCLFKKSTENCPHKLGMRVVEIHY